MFRELVFSCKGQNCACCILSLGLRMFVSVSLTKTNDVIEGKGVFSDFGRLCYIVILEIWIIFYLCCVSEKFTKHTEWWESHVMIHHTIVCIHCQLP